jgi:two-component system sensor histidine kinase KdpD
VDELLRLSLEIDFHFIKGQDKGGPAPAARRTPSGTQPWWSYAAALGIVGACTGACFAMYPYFALANLIMVYLLGVMAVAVWLPRRASILAAAASVLAFDFCFVPPRYSFSVADMAYLVTFGVMFAVALVIGGMAWRIKAQAQSAGQLERQASELSRLSRRLPPQRDRRACRRNPGTHRRGLRLHDAGPSPGRGNGSPTHSCRMTGVSPGKGYGRAQWVFDNGHAAGFSTRTLADPTRFLPLRHNRHPWRPGRAAP